MLSQRHVIFAILIALTAGYFLVHIPQIEKSDTTPYYTDIVKPYIKDCNLAHVPDLRAPLKLYLTCVSDQAFGNPRVITLLFSSTLIPLTFFLGKKIIGGYIIPIIGTMIFCCSNIFEFYVNLTGYEQSWSVLFLGAMLISFYKPIYSGPLFALSLFSKGLPLFFMPFFLYIINKSNIKGKNIVYASVGGVILFSILFTIFVGPYILQKQWLVFHPENIGEGISNILFVFRHDPLQYILFGISVIYLARSSDVSAKPLLLFISSYYATVVLFPVFTIYFQYDYRMIPMIVFDSIASIMILRDIKFVYMLMEITPSVLSKAIEIAHVKLYKT